MFLAKVFVLLVPVVAIQAIKSYTGSCQCYSTKLRGHAYAHGLFRNVFYTDFEKNMFLEIRQDGSKVLHVLNEKVTYNFDSNNNCRKSPIPHYWSDLVQCMPEDSEYEEIIMPDGERISAFTYVEDGYHIARWLREDNHCLPYKVFEWQMEGNVKHIKSEFSEHSVSKLMDGAIFDLDLSSCV